MDLRSRNCHSFFHKLTFQKLVGSARAGKGIGSRQANSHEWGRQRNSLKDRLPMSPSPKPGSSLSELRSGPTASRSHCSSAICKHPQNLPARRPASADRHDGAAASPICFAACCHLPGQLSRKRLHTLRKRPGEHGSACPRAGFEAPGAFKASGRTLNNEGKAERRLH